MKRTWITVKRGILEPKHRFALGELIYLFLYILDITGWESGTIEEWSDKGVAEEMSMPLSTLRYQRNKLERLGYISVEQKQHGIRVILHNWTNPKEYTGKVYNKSKIPTANPSANPDNNPSANPSFNDEPTNAVPSYSQKSQIIKQKKPKNIPLKDEGKPSKNKELENSMIARFTEITGVKIIPTEYAKNQTLWYKPIQDMLAQVDNNLPEAQSIMEEAIEKLHKIRYTVSDPLSVLKTFKGILTDEHLRRQNGH